MFGGDLAAAEKKEFLPDEAYYNVRLFNDNSTKIIPAEFRDQRPTPILENPNEYRMAVARFSIPLSVPIFNWSETNNERASLVHVASGTTITQPITYIGNSPDFPDGSAEGPIWLISQYLAMVNGALAAAHAILFGLFPVLGPDPPYFIFDSSVALFRLFVPTTYNSTVPGPGPNDVDIYLTYPSARLFADFSGNVPYAADYPSPTDSPLQFRYRGVNLNNSNLQVIPPAGGVSYWRMDGAFDATPRWSDVLFVALDTNTLPVQPEMGVPAQDATNQNQNQLIWSFTDFALPQHRPTREPADFAASGTLRWYQLGSPKGSVGPLYSVDIRASYVDRFGVRRPLQLSFGDVLDVKILFRRRDLDLS